MWRFLADVPVPDVASFPMLSVAPPLAHAELGGKAGAGKKEAKPKPGGLLESGRVKAIQPLLRGKSPYSSFFEDGSRGNLRDEVSSATLERLKQHAAEIKLPLSRRAAGRTIKGTLDELLTFQTVVQWWDVGGSPAHGQRLVGPLPGDLDLSHSHAFERQLAELVFSQARPAPSPPPSRLEFRVGG